MAGTRTAPDVSVASPNYKQLSYSLISNAGKTKAFSFLMDAAATLAQVETFLAALQAATRSSLYEASIADVWVGAAVASNAEANYFQSISDVIRISWKDVSTGNYRRAYTPAPMPSQIGAGLVVDVTSALWDNVNNAFDALQPSAFTFLNTEFVQNSQRNQKIKNS